MAQQRSKRSSRKRGKTTGSVPRAVPSQRRTERAQKHAQAEVARRRRPRGLEARGERPPSWFGLPVSEFLIFVGIISLIVGFINSGGPALIVGIVVVALGVFEVSAREHFTGYRSHALLLALVPTVALELLLVVLFGGGRTKATVFGAILLPVFAATAWMLRRRYRVAHQRRKVRAPRA
jgi:hypothetical protein